MDILGVLLAIGLIHLSLYFLDFIFATCSHWPYFYFLKNTGFEIQLFRIKWYTTVFNRKIIKLGMDRSRFWTAWFNAGVIITVLILPFAVFLIMKMTYNIWSRESNSKYDNTGITLEPMLPGVDLPFNEIGYYIVTLGVCTAVHEFGHALAAAREDVQIYGIGVIFLFVIPMAYVNLKNDQLLTLPLRNQLRIACAGIWHNTILATLAALLLAFSAWFWSPLFSVGQGIFVKTISPNSPVLGPAGLFERDIIYQLNDCKIENNEDWYYCILQAIHQPTPGYCIKQIFVQEYDESVPSRQKSNGVVNCCTPDSENNGNVCFEHIEGPQSVPLNLPPNSCLPVRTMINQSQNFCHTNYECSSIDTNCMKPSLDNNTKIIQLKRKVGSDVLYIGHPAAIYQSVEVSDWTPKYPYMFTSNWPEGLTLLCKYLTIFSAGLAVINVVPCFFFDGQHILNILTKYVINSDRARNQNIQEVLTLTICCIGTILLMLNVVYLILNKF